ncbi:MAG: C40 family peptidase [Burkholderiales bacterium]|nr:C40 family peptidase [Burkholderiales bacterium]
MSGGTTRLGVIAASLVLISGCAVQPITAPPDSGTSTTHSPGQRAPVQTAGDTAVSVAIDHLGTPYRFGGNGPDGFDCSGLVRFSYRAAGIDLPRATTDQRKAGRSLAPDEALRPGDLLFYAPGRKAPLHVGLYVSDGAFVHAPSSGGQVRTERMEAPYWRRSFVEARRVADGASEPTR